MNRWIRWFTPLLALAVGLVATSVTAADTPAKVSWRISGDLEEACLCSPPCPCWFNSLPTKMHCGGTQVLFIKRGHYGKVRLDGLALAEFVQSPDNKTMMESFGSWDFSYLYLDERANPEQRQALEAIGKVVMPFGSSRNQKVQVTAITRSQDGAEHQVRIGSQGEFAGRLLEGGLGGPPKIVNPPGADPLHGEYFQGQTARFVYTDAGQNWKTANSNYMLAHFDLTSDQYEKYTAGLAQKMSQLQPSK